MQRPTDTRERLLATAAELIWRSSYHATGVDRICAAAGVNKGSFYHFFASKEDLAIAAIEAQWAEIKPRVDEVFSAAEPPLERLRRYARHVIAMQEEMSVRGGTVCGCPLVALGSEMGTQAPALRAKVEQLLDVKVRYLESAIRDAHAAGVLVAPDPARKAQLVIDVVEGALTRARILNHLGPIHGLEEIVLEVLGVAPGSASSTSSTPERPDRSVTPQLTEASR